jgi:N-acetylglucosaminyldiphosphoundecaprenol N-acetyl-beta-D-mannosaminyltransferase
MGNFAIGEALGVHFYAGAFDNTADSVVRQALEKRGGFGVLCNVHILMTSRREPLLRSALDDAWAVFPDGVPIVWLLKRSEAPGTERVCGIDLMPAVIERGVARGIRHYLLGSTEEVRARLERNLLERFPDIELVGSAGPFGDQAALDAVVPQIREVEPHIVWCAFGAPKQELWMHRNAAALAPALVLGVGAAFEYHAGTKKRAPVWMQRSGLEWLFRLVTEPRRLWSRYLTTNTAFCVLVAREGLRGRLRRRPSATATSPAQTLSSLNSPTSPEADARSSVNQRDAES